MPQCVFIAKQVDPILQILNYTSATSEVLRLFGSNTMKGFVSWSFKLYPS